MNHLPSTKTQNAKAFPTFNIDAKNQQFYHATIGYDYRAGILQVDEVAFFHLLNKPELYVSITILHFFAELPKDYFTSNRYLVTCFSKSWTEVRESFEMKIQELEISRCILAQERLLILLNKGKRIRQSSKTRQDNEKYQNDEEIHSRCNKKDAVWKDEIIEGLVPQELIESLLTVKALQEQTAYRDPLDMRDKVHSLQKSIKSTIAQLQIFFETQYSNCSTLYTKASVTLNFLVDYNLLGLETDFIGQFQLASLKICAFWMNGQSNTGKKAHLAQLISEIFPE